MGDLKTSGSSSTKASAHGIPYHEKPGPLDELLRLLKRLLHGFLRCVTCGCYGVKDGGDVSWEVYDAYLMEEERTAVENLLAYLDSGE